MPESHPFTEPIIEQYLESPKVEIEFEYYWNQLSAGLEGLVKESDLKSLEVAAMAKEAKFYNKVLSKVSQLANSSTESIVCLFDIDGTIGEVKDEESSIYLHTLLRPAYTRVVGDLAVKYGDRVKFGLLSMRPESHLQEEMDNPTFLAPARAFMDDNHVYSSEELFRADPYINSGTSNSEYSKYHSGLNEAALRRCLSEMDGVIEGALLDATSRGQVNLFDWYDPKLTILKGLLEEEPDTIFVIVDDLAYAECIDASNQRLHGIGVRTEKQMLLPNSIW